MRRSDREIQDRREIDDILSRASVCYLGLNDRGECYVVPVNYGYDGSHLYVHSARRGRKIDVLKGDNRVSFAAHVDNRIVESAEACKFTMKYRSVMGTGVAELIDDPAEKMRGLDVIMRHYTSGELRYDPAILDKVIVIRIEIRSLSGKKSV